MLHAWQLSFEHPVSRQKLHFTAPPPDDFKPWLDLAGAACL